jgi:hypothetical protein
MFAPMRRSAATLGPLLAIALAGAACGDDASPGGGGAGGGGDATTTGQAGSATGAGAASSGVTEQIFPDADPLPGHDACEVTITRDIPVASASHVELCADVDYATNPPSGGDHWPRWAAFRAYDAPVPRPLLVHSLEHGAVALLHDCDGCTDEVVAAFDEVTTAYGADPRCIATGSAVARFVIAPDPALDHPVALAAWGATYVATCIDRPSLTAFVEEHYARGPEDTCAAGVDPSDVDCD